MAYISNKKARYDYQILSTIQGGLSLLGTEVKSIRNGKGSLIGSKVLIRGGEAFLVGSNIPAHQEQNAPVHFDPERNRKVLFKKSELLKLNNEVESNKLTLIPLSIYNSKRVLKMEIGIGKKKNSRDKREDIKRKEAKRSIKKELGI